MKVDEEKAGVKKLDPTSYKRRQPEQGEDALKTSCEAQGGGGSENSVFTTISALLVGDYRELSLSLTLGSVSLKLVDQCAMS